MFKSLQSFYDFDKKFQDETLSLINSLESKSITPKNYHIVLHLALKLYLFKDQPVLKLLSLRLLEGLEATEVPIEDLISPQFVKDCYSNARLAVTDELVEIFQWILRNTKSEELKMAIKQEADSNDTSRGKASTSSALPPGNDFQYLQNIIQNVLAQQKPVQKDTAKDILDEMVRKLAEIKIPFSETTKSGKENAALEFTKEIVKIGGLLDRLVKSSQLSQHVVFEALLTGIESVQGNAGPGLVVVLQLLTPQFVTDAVKTILVNKHNDDAITRGLDTLFGWMFVWSQRPLISEWIIAYMKGLHEVSKHHILEKVVIRNTPHMLTMLRFPVYRPANFDVLLHVLCSMQNNPSVFQAACEVFPAQIQCLKRDHNGNKKQSQTPFSLQQLVDISHALMERFPPGKCQKNYVQLKEAIGDIQISEDYSKWLSPNPWPTASDRGSSPIYRPPSTSTMAISQLTIPTEFKDGPGVGLHNLGNTCYMNSVLQALFMTQDFRYEILTSNKTLQPIIFGLQTLFALMQFSGRACQELPDSILNNRPAGFTVNQQHDSSEYMNYLLDLLHEQEKSKNFGRHSPIECGPSSGPSSYDKKVGETIVQRIFTGHALVTYRCYTCSNESRQQDAFRDLQLSIPMDRSNITVQDLLDYYLRPEKLCDDNKYYCERCRALSDAERKFTVTELPKYLILTLKHFRYDSNLQQRNKLFKDIKYAAVVKLNAVKYTMYAAIVHIGHTPDLGHYLTYARAGGPSTRMWYKLNDNFVCRAQFDDLLTMTQPSTPYILFYARDDIQPPPRVKIHQLTKKVYDCVQDDINRLKQQQLHYRNISPTVPYKQNKPSATSTSISSDDKYLDDINNENRIKKDETQQDDFSNSYYN